MDLNLKILPSFPSYLIMQKCWYSEPDARPAFSELASTLSTMLEMVAGYVELTMCLPATATDEVDIDVLENPNEVNQEEIEMEKNPMSSIRDIPTPRNGVSLTTN